MQIVVIVFLYHQGIIFQQRELCTPPVDIECPTDPTAPKESLQFNSYTIDPKSRQLSKPLDFICAQEICDKGEFGNPVNCRDMTPYARGQSFLPKKFSFLIAANGVGFVCAEGYHFELQESQPEEPFVCTADSSSSHN